MKTAIWLYLFMFVAFFDLHAQYPILSPFALSIGAAPSFIGLIMGAYSITHLPGNLIAGYGVDRYGSKQYIIASLIAAGFVLVYQSHVTDPWHLLVIRSISGFVLAFLSPACLALLAKLAEDRVHQGKLMAGNGLVHTMASVVSPAAGAFLVAKLGFSTSFTVLGWGLVATGVLAMFGVKEVKPAGRNAGKSGSFERTGHSATINPAGNGRIAPHGHAMHVQRSPAKPFAPLTMTDEPPDGVIPWLFFGVPLALSCAQGILFFELPLMKSAQASILTSGILFSLVSFGALTTLSMLFLNRTSALLRTVFGSLALALVFFGLSIHWPIPLFASLVMIGMAKGVIFPAIATLLAQVTGTNRYGRVFSILSIAFSVGAFLGPVLAGQLRTAISPYFVAFFMLMLGLSLLPFGRLHRLASA